MTADPSQVIASAAWGDGTPLVRIEAGGATVVSTRAGVFTLDPDDALTLADTIDGHRQHLRDAARRAAQHAHVDALADLLHTILDTGAQVTGYGAQAVRAKATRAQALALADQGIAPDDLRLDGDETYEFSHDGVRIALSPSGGAW